MTKLESKAYNLGYLAGLRGVSRKNNPFLDRSEQGEAWLRGHTDGKAA